MICTVSPLLTRLRRHRGLWVLAIAVLLIKLVSSSICLADAPSAQLAGGQAASVPAVVEVVNATPPADTACLLGETGNCHCACAHAATMTSRMGLSFSSIDARVESSRFARGLVPTMTGSLLRPPIA